VDSKKLLRIAFSVLLIPLGAVFILLSTGNSREQVLILNVGIALVVAGIVSTFHETVLSQLDSDANKNAPETIANRVVEKLERRPFPAVGIQLLDSVRSHFDGYFHWTVHEAAEALFFAGRSVLHRIDSDVRRRGLGSAEEAMVLRMQRGATIRVLFMDPRSDLIARVAHDENRNERHVREDLCYSLGVCRRLYQRLQEAPHLAGSVAICLYDEIPYFAYHQVGDETIIGFYFAPQMGHTSGAYRVLDGQTQLFFRNHFDFLFAKATDTWIVKKALNADSVSWNEELFQALRGSLCQTLGEPLVNDLLEGRRGGAAPAA